MSGALAFLALLLLIGIIIYLLIKLVKREKVDKGVFISIGVLVAIIFILGTIEGEKKEPKDEIDPPKVEQEQKVEVKETSNQNRKTEEKAKADDKEIEESKIKFAEGALKKSFEGKADIVYVPETKEFKIIPIGEMAEGMLPLVKYKDTQEVQESWGNMREEFKGASESMSKNIATGITMHLINPYNQENTLLTIMDGIVVYDALKQ